MTTQRPNEECRTGKGAAPTREPVDHADCNVAPSEATRIRAPKERTAQADRITELLDPCSEENVVPQAPELATLDLPTEQQGSTGSSPATKLQGAFDAVGRYRLRQRIGCGGFGEVWIAYDPTLRRMVATKIPRLSSLARAPWLPTAFWGEAVMAARAADRGCGVPVYDFGWDKKLPFIVMQLMEGSLLDVIREGPLSVRRACSLMLALAKKLHRAHLSGIVHCDLKPSNILLHTTGEVYPSDFCSSTEPGRTRHVALLGDAVLGTLPYMAPEQLEGKPHAYGCRTDCYAFGVIFYELLAGKRPFSGESTEEILERVKARDYVRLCELRPDVPKELSDLVDRCLSPLQSGRPEDARVIRTELSRLLRRQKHRC